MIVVENLTRKYGEVTAVDDVSFRIGEGEIVGLLGQNGAGKTTVLKLLTGYLEPTAGSIVIDGHDIEADRTAVQARVGYLPENCPVYPDMSVVDYLDYAAALRGVSTTDRAASLRLALAATELFEKANQSIGTLSRGFRQRVGVAQAVMHQPKIVILDEPTNGLDPSQIKHMRDLIKDMSETATIVISTHVLQEVQAVCGRVIIIDQGRLALDSPLGDICGEARLRLVTNGSPSAVEELISSLVLVEGIDRVPSQGNANAFRLTLNGHAAEAVAPKVARAIIDKGFDLIALHSEQRDLESVFAEITAVGASAREATHD